MPDVVIPYHRVKNWPLYWFAALEKAVENGDHQAAAKAERELKRLGVDVSYGHPRPERREVNRG